MFSLLSASHSISSHLAPENCKDLAFFLVNGFLKATPWFSSTVSADLMGYYSCSRTGNKNREGFESICVRRKKKNRDMFEAEMRKRRKWEIWEHVHICVFPSHSEVRWFRWKIELTGVPVSPAEQAAAAGGGYLIIFGLVQLVFLAHSFHLKMFYSPFSTKYCSLCAQASA